MVFIANFNNSKELSEIKAYYDNHKGTNINFLLNDFQMGETTWSVPKDAAPGDIIVFMCAKEARHNLGLATSHIPADYSDEFRNFVDQQKALYKQYSGCLLGCGRIISVPQQDQNWWMSHIRPLVAFPVPVHIDEFKSFITISRTNAITYLNDDQWNRLMWLVNQKNPGFFDRVIPPDVEDLDQEFEDRVRKEITKSLDTLLKQAKKKSGPATESIVRTKTYHRDATIAAYVKKRANGCCQLCGAKAPFDDQSGEPYLECHHIDWLSKGGMDSIDNCVALCPNCHRKMHIVNAAADIKKLKAAVRID